MNILFQIALQFSRLPLRFFYILSDVVFFFIYYVIRYRRKVVFENLQNSFPEKSAQELREIEKHFYVNFCDYIFETFKTFTISPTELRVRVQHLNRHIFDDAKTEQKNVILLAGHIFNWEWFNILPEIVPQRKGFPVYRKVQNNFWEEKIKLIRNRFGNHSLEAKEVIRQIFRNPNDGDSIYMFVADQTPHISEVSYGLRFLNQDTPAFVGYDKLSTRLDLVFVYCEMKKVKRGYYQVNYERIFPAGDKFQPHEVVQKFHQKLENNIRKHPDNYLWSHRRWKYKSAIKIMQE